ncbi:MAG: NUDIX hydrolase [Steroidobacteraceae bacterium]|nr:NUDIX hydrolase [Steroidobacteraceae bacterium]
MRWNPEVTVAAVVELRDRFLFVEERIAGRLVLNQPAGHLEDGETLIEAVIRETREETAWRLEPEALVGTYLWRSPENGRTFLRFAFCGVVDDHRVSQALDTGIVRALWLSHEQVLAQSARTRSPLVLRCLEDYLLGKRQPLDSVATLELETALEVASVVNL